ncbi:MAG: SGNH hydrolase domain-containing protein, partial [Pseudomonadota bacterium]
RISYSVYLIHWPLFVFALFFLRDQTSPIVALGMISAALAVGAVMYHIVETPFRRKGTAGFAISTRALGWSSFAIAAALTIASTLIHLEKGYANRFPPQMVALLDQLDVAIGTRTDAVREFSCNATQSSADVYFDVFDSCLPDERDNMIVVLGDSHAADVYMGLAAAYPDAALVQLTGNGCNFTKDPDENTFCAQFMRHWRTWITENADRIAAIIYNQSGGALRGAAPDRPNTTMINRLFTHLPQFKPDDVPFYFWGPRAGFTPTIDIAIIGSADLAALRGYYDPDGYAAEAALDQVLRKQFAGSDVRYASAFDAFCNQRCPTLTDEDKLFVVDYAHWTKEGAVQATQALVAASPGLLPLLTR